MNNTLGAHQCVIITVTRRQARCTLCSGVAWSAPHCRSSSCSLTHSVSVVASIGIAAVCPGWGGFASYQARQASLPEGVCWSRLSELTRAVCVAAVLPALPCGACLMDAGTRWRLHARMWSRYSSCSACGTGACSRLVQRICSTLLTERTGEWPY